MKRQALPRLLIFLISALRFHHPHLAQDVDIVEWFSGAGHIKQVAAQRGINAMSFEVNDDRIWQDMSSPYGFVQALLVDF